MRRLRTAILISGRGSNMRALIKECEKSDSAAEIALVISNVNDALGLKKAAELGLDCDVINHSNFQTREQFEEALTNRLVLSEIEFICLAGFMRILTKKFIDRWYNRLINIHPSLLPAYPGLNTHERAISDGTKFAGCTVHFVRVGVDTGPIIIQSAVPILINDTPDILAARVLEEEHKCYPFALRQVALGNTYIENGIVKIKAASQPKQSFTNPEPITNISIETKT